MQIDDEVEFVIIGDAIYGPADKEGPYKTGGDHVIQWFPAGMDPPAGWTRKRGTTEMGYPRPEGPIDWSFGRLDQEAEWDRQFGGE